MTRDEFLEAWKSWDNDPRDEKTAARMVECDRVYGQQLGLQAIHLRDLLASWRRAGRTREESLRAVEAGLEARPRPRD